MRLGAALILFASFSANEENHLIGMSREPKAKAVQLTLITLSTAAGGRIKRTARDVVTHLLAV